MDTPCAIQPQAKRRLNHRAREKGRRTPNNLQVSSHQPIVLAVDVGATAVLHPSNEVSVVDLLQDGAGADCQPPPAVYLVLEKLANVHVAVDVPARCCSRGDRKMCCFFFTFLGVGVVLTSTLWSHASDHRPSRACPQSLKPRRDMPC